MERMLLPSRPRAVGELLDVAAPVITESFAYFMWSHVRRDADADLLRRCFGWVERLAATDDPDARSLVVVDILDAAPGRTRAGRWLGPTTRALFEAADPNVTERIPFVPSESLGKAARE